MFPAFVFIFGLVIGSFLNALIYRLYHGYSMRGFSFCPHCRHQLGPLDLIPVVSFVYLKARCRYCKKKISWQYPLVELTTAIVFTLLASQLFILDPSQSFWPQIIGQGLCLAVASLLIAIFVFDWKYYLIPDGFVVAGAVAALLYRIFSPGQSFVDGLLGAVILAGFFGGLYLVSHGRWIGLGDAKLGIFLGLFLGWKMSLVMLMLAYVSGALVGVSLILMRKKTLQGILPFGTFLTFAALIALIWGDQILKWYLHSIAFY